MALQISNRFTNRFTRSTRISQHSLHFLYTKHTTISSIAKALSSCSSSTGDIISTTERLKQELDITTQRQEIVSLFLRDYQLSNEEIKALREEDLNESFFKAISHVQEIHVNCKILLRTHHQPQGEYVINEGCDVCIVTSN
ncbi:Golgi transport complex subunit 6 [Ranunculus cassubicifolius]